MSKYVFALGQMQPDADGRRPQALIVIDEKSGEKIARFPYDAAAEVLLASLKLAYSGVQG